MQTWRWAGLAVVVVLAGAGPVQAQDGRKEVAEGNRLYAEGRFGDAHERYVEAMREAPGTPLIRFNEGSALYQSQEYQRALEAFQDVATGEEGDLNAGAWYNLGNTFVQQQQLPQALEAYKQALRRNPADLDAKHNLEVVLGMMDQEQNQEQDQNQDQNQEQQDENPPGGSGGEDSGDQNPSGQDQGPEGAGRPEGQGDNRADPQEGEGEGSEGGEQPLPPSQMSRQDAERLLQAVAEDPGEVERHPVDPRGPRPRKDW